jgi:signal transduction histidine kinase
MKPNHRKYFRFFFIFFLGLIIFPKVYAQEKGLIQSKHFSSKDYRAGTQNWAIVEDQRGVMYFGNGAGVLEYNGETWNLIRLSNESSVRSLAVSDKGTIFVGAYNEIGYLQPNNLGELTYISLIPKINKELLPFGEVWDINCFGDTVFFLSDRFLIRYNNGKIDYWESESKSYYLSFSVNNELFVQELGVGLMKFVNSSLQLIEKGDYFSNIKVHSIFTHNQGMLIGSRSNGFFLYKSEKNGVSIVTLDELSAEAKKLNSYFQLHSFYHGVQLTSNLLALGSITGDILIVNNKYEVIDIINHEIIGIKSPTLYLYFSKQQSLWLALDNGISLVDVLSPFRYWNEEKGFSGIITDIARLNNALYISTGSGILYTSCSYKNAYKINSFDRVKGDFEQAWEYLYFKVPSSRNESLNKNTFSAKDSDNDTILLVATRKGLFHIMGSNSTRITNYESVITLYQSIHNPFKVYVGLLNGLATLTYSNEQWVDDGFHYNLDCRINDIAEDVHGNLWLTSDHLGVYRVTNPLSLNPDSIKIVFFDTNHGIPSVRHIWIVDHLKPLAFYIDEEYYVFCDSINAFKKDISRKRNVDETPPEISNEQLAWARVWGSMITEYYVTHIGDSTLWFGTNTAVYRYNPIAKRDYSQIYPALIRRVSTGDSILFYGSNIFPCDGSVIGNNEQKCVNASPIVDLGTILKHKENSITFTYSLPFFEGEKPNEYSFWLVGYDNDWSEWSNETKKEYTNLPHGNYRFRVKARNLYYVESEPAEFVFIVLPPWYKTYYAFLGYILFLGLFVYLIVRFYTYRLIVEKDKLEKLVKERTQEILIQKEEILVQAEHLKEANDWITAKNQELEEQKRLIEHKKNQLEISDATKNKFFRIIAHDLRNPISTVVGTTNHILSNFDLSDSKTTKHLLEETINLSMTTYNLLENLLDWSTSQMGEIRFNPTAVELKSVIAQNIELVNSKIESKKINLEMSVDSSIMVFADENMLQTVIRNLISNAVKFTHDYGVITINATLEESMCYLSISDTGIGISDENLKNLFRIDKDVRSYGTHNEKGAGLGLILCKEFIEINGGAISVKSQQGKGSEFIISLKLV